MCIWRSGDKLYTIIFVQIGVRQLSRGLATRANTRLNIADRTMDSHDLVWTDGEPEWTLGLAFWPRQWAKPHTQWFPYNRRWWWQWFGLLVSVYPLILIFCLFFLDPAELQFSRRDKTRLWLHFCVRGSVIIDVCLIKTCPPRPPVHPIKFPLAHVLG